LSLASLDDVFADLIKPQQEASAGKQEQ